MFKSFVYAYFILNIKKKVTVYSYASGTLGTVK